MWVRGSRGGRRSVPQAVQLRCVGPLCGCGVVCRCGCLEVCRCRGGSHELPRAAQCRCGCLDVEVTNYPEQPGCPTRQQYTRTATAALGGMGRLSGHYQREGSPCLVLAPELAERPGHTSSASRPPAPRKRTRQRTCGGTGSSGRGSGCVCLGGPGRDTRGGARIGPAWRSRAGPTPKIEFLHSTAYLPITSTTAHLS